MMDTVRAMHETISLMKTRVSPGRWDVGPDGCTPRHIEEMIDRVAEASSDKKSRWLGWMQGVCAAQGLITLEEAKEINRRCA